MYVIKIAVAYGIVSVWRQIVRFLEIATYRCRHLATDCHINLLYLNRHTYSMGNFGVLCTINDWWSYWSVCLAYGCYSKIKTSSITLQSQNIRWLCCFLLARNDFPGNMHLPARITMTKRTTTIEMYFLLLFLFVHYIINIHFSLTSVLNIELTITSLPTLYQHELYNKPDPKGHGTKTLDAWGSTQYFYLHASYPSFITTGLP